MISLVEGVGNKDSVVYMFHIWKYNIKMDFQEVGCEGMYYEGWNFNSGNYLFTTDTNRYMFRSFTVLQCSHQHCVQPVASDVEVVGYL